MNNIFLKPLKKVHAIAFPETSRFGRNWKMFSSKEYASNLIHDAILSGQPRMIARLGSTELAAMANHVGVHRALYKKNYKGYLSNQTPAWWWNPSSISQMQKWSGFFPADRDHVESFCEMMIEMLSEVDILGSWLKEEAFFADELGGSKKIVLEDLEPFFVEKPWTQALKGKKVLVVHPFDESIQTQYKKRELLFDKDLLPEFELKTIKAVQTLAGQKSEYETWFYALEHMKEQISAIDFDVCIIGCGAYGFPLAAHVKSLGKVAIHLGGVTQILFGIKGARWEEFIVYPYQNLFNENWIRPLELEKPKNFSSVEGGCYW
jgi:hypothetical protein